MVIYLQHITRYLGYRIGKRLPLLRSCRATQPFPILTNLISERKTWLILTSPKENLMKRNLNPVNTGGADVDSPVSNHFATVHTRQQNSSQCRSKLLDLANIGFAAASIPQNSRFVMGRIIHWNNAPLNRIHPHPVSA